MHHEKHVSSQRLEHDQLQSDRLRRLLAYWQRIRANNPVPPRSRFDPVDIPYILPRVVLVEVQDKSGDFYFRVIGTETEDAGNRDRKSVV